MLPLPPAKVRDTSLENHLALVVVNAGEGGNDQMSCLLRVVYLAYYLRDETASGADVRLYRQAEQALNTCIERAVQSHNWALLEDEQELLGQVLSRHDEQLATVPAYRYVRAWEQMRAFLKAERASPIIG
ncbi:hypothetical protein [Burkholderia multivorans]|uniref:hypothetical protein n=1 Tax=Burkholderia multivorans TaxID=87883 RepID=UPI00280ABC7F|nr:hypothetical protein [Burkholderia multivorans]